MGIQHAKRRAYLWTHVRQGDKKEEVNVKVKEIWKGANLKEVPFDGVFCPLNRRVGQLLRIRGDMVRSIKVKIKWWKMMLIKENLTVEKYRRKIETAKALVGWR